MKVPTINDQVTILIAWLGAASPHLSTIFNPSGRSLPGDEKGSVTYKVGEETAVLSFDNPVFGSNKCSVSGIGGSCTAGIGQIAEFTYSLRKYWNRRRSRTKYSKWL